jgi:hypothetical protein
MTPVMLILLFIATMYFIIIMKVPNEKHPERCLNCGRIKGKGQGVLYKGRVEQTCDSEYKERLMNIKLKC